MIGRAHKVMKLLNMMNRPATLVKLVERVRYLQFHQAQRFANFTKRSGSSFGGFTLIEVVVALGIFTVVVVLAVGAALSINTAQLKARDLQALQDNLRFALESMTKEMRTGSAFQPAGPLGGSAFGRISFARAGGAMATYCLANGAIEKASGGAGCPSGGSSPVTGDDISVEALVFYIIGHGPGSADGQPRITVALRASPRDPRFPSTFRLQSSVTPRGREQ